MKSKSNKAWRRVSSLEAGHSVSDDDSRLPQVILFRAVHALHIFLSSAFDGESHEQPYVVEGIVFGKLNAPSVRMADVSQRSVMNIYSHFGHSHSGHKHTLVLLTPLLVIKHPYPMEKLPCYRHIS